METYPQKTAIRLPLALKLVILTGVTILATVILVTQAAHKIVSQRDVQLESLLVTEKTAFLANEVNEIFKSAIEKSQFVGRALTNSDIKGMEVQKILETTFLESPNITSIEVYKRENLKLLRRATNEKNLERYGLSAHFIDILREQNPISSMIFALNGETEIFNSSFEDGAPLVTIATPFDDTEGGELHSAKTEVIVMDLTREPIEKLFSKKRGFGETLFLIDKRGNLIAHPDEPLTIHRKNFSDNPIVQEAMSKDVPHGEKIFSDQISGDSLMGTFSKTHFGPIVIGQVSMRAILETAREARKRSLEIAAFSIFISLFIVALFSTSITGPLKKLAIAAIEIATGNFDVRVPVTTQDEVGDVTVAFDKMVDGLKERDKIRDQRSKAEGH